MWHAKKQNAQLVGHEQQYGLSLMGRVHAAATNKTKNNFDRASQD